MADLTIDDIGTVLHVQLLSLDSSQNPPVQTPLDLTNALKVELTYLITDPTALSPALPTKTVQMSILSPPANGGVFYSFQAGDLAKPANMGKNGVFKYTIKVTFLGGNVLHINTDQQLTIKDDSVL